MWGTDLWGAMIWGGAPAVPLFGPLGLVALTACFLLGGVMLQKRRHLRGLTSLLAIALLTAPLMAVAAVSLPYVFMNGQVADADQVNANFAALANGVGGDRFYLKDVKASGVNGGQCTSGSWLTRTLNTAEGDLASVSLVGNQFTLQPGTYRFDVRAPAFITSQHRARLYNVTDALSEITGSTSFSHNGSPTLATSHIQGIVTLAAETTFEIQQQCTTTHNLGFGLAASFGEPEVYTQVYVHRTD